LLAIALKKASVGKGRGGRGGITGIGAALRSSYAEICCKIPELPRRKRRQPRTRRSELAPVRRGRASAKRYAASRNRLLSGTRLRPARRSRYVSNLMTTLDGILRGRVRGRSLGPPRDPRVGPRYTIKQRAVHRG
jgi:hypothetical protein